MPKNPDRDHWRTLANRLFRDYVRERLGANSVAWGAWGATHSNIPSRWPSVTLHDSPQAHCTKIAVTYKNQFADLMAELPELPDADDIRDRWQAAMREAEADIARYLATAPAAGQLALS